MVETWNRKLAIRPIGLGSGVIYNLLGRAGLREAVVRLTTQHSWTRGGVVNYTSGSRRSCGRVVRFTSVYSGQRGRLASFTTQFFLLSGGLVCITSGFRKLREGVARFTSATRRDDKKSSASNVGALLDIGGVVFTRTFPASSAGRTWLSGRHRCSRRTVHVKYPTCNTHNPHRGKTLLHPSVASIDES